ncbi:hypothetical protein EDB86DRAFT_2826916 [Lactarius hatsudake]|nr:hypothetical protein EDB86DRAFT_2826916 [Lactarius hatsudake]KAH9052912.1 hypothetical protein EDB83DRAFT_2316526 [Lactarius deliciosus]
MAADRRPWGLLIQVGFCLSIWGARKGSLFGKGFDERDNNAGTEGMGFDAPGCRVGRSVSGEGSGNIGKRLVDHRLGRFHGSGYACHQKRRSGKASDEPEIDTIIHFLP